MLLKAGMTELLKSICGGDTSMLNRRKKKPADILQIYPTRMKELAKQKGSLLYLDVMRWEREMNLHLDEKELKTMTKAQRWAWDWKKLMRNILQYIPIKKTLNRIQEYGKEYKGNTGAALRELSDYLHIRNELGYDMTNSVYLHPRSLKQAHAEMVEEQTRRKDEKYIQEALKKYTQIPKREPTLRKRYGFRKNGYIIRPAKDAEEIIMEGRILHHCVGSANYLTKHNEGETAILFMRSEEIPDIPYITIEVQRDQILQWYGAHDSKPEDEAVLACIAAFEKRIKTKVAKEADQEEGLLPAAV
jgi:hypothetical protein